MTVFAPACMALIVSACAAPDDPVAVAAHRSSGSTVPATSAVAPDSTTPVTAPETTPSTALPTVPSTVTGELSRSTSAGDRRYPRLGSADIDVEQYDVRLTYDVAGF